MGRDLPARRRDGGARRRAGRPGRRDKPLGAESAAARAGRAGARILPARGGGNSSAGRRRLAVYGLADAPRLCRDPGRDRADGLRGAASARDDFAAAANCGWPRGRGGIIAGRAAPRCRHDPRAQNPRRSILWSGAGWTEFCGGVFMACMSSARSIFARSIPNRPVVGCVNHTNWWDGFVLYVLSLATAAARHLSGDGREESASLPLLSPGWAPSGST